MASSHLMYHTQSTLTVQDSGLGPLEEPELEGEMLYWPDSEHLQNEEDTSFSPTNGMISGQSGKLAQLPRLNRSSESYARPRASSVDNLIAGLQGIMWLEPCFLGRGTSGY
jgi:hypothetical protein